MSAVYVKNLTINCGADFSETLELESTSSNSLINLTNYTAYAQMRKHAGSTSFVTFSTSILLPATSGSINISLTAQQTSEIKPGRYVYDIIIENSGIRTRVVEGMVLVREGVTQL